MVSKKRRTGLGGVNPELMGASRLGHQVKQ
jgi:hypothetical protein